MTGNERSDKRDSGIVVEGKGDDICSFRLFFIIRAEPILTTGLLCDANKKQSSSTNFS
jgi:hypothetical protein